MLYRVLSRALLCFTSALSEVVPVCSTGTVFWLGSKRNVENTRSKVNVSFVASRSLRGRGAAQNFERQRLTPGSRRFGEVATSIRLY